MSESTSFIRLFVGVLLSATGVVTSCPIELSPPSVVVRYGDSVSVNCSTSESLLDGIGWEATEGGISLKEVSHLAWTVAELKEWSISAKCYINLSLNSSFNQCFKILEIVLYTFPENISLSSSSGPNMVMHEGKQNNFTCDIQNIAPVKNLTVKWYKGDEMVFEDTFKNPSKKPVNQSSIFSFTPTRQDNGATIRCEEHLDLRPEGPQLNASSEEYYITVHYAPSQIVELEDSEVDIGSDVWLKCSSKGNPRPNYFWDYYRTVANVVEENEDGVSRLHIYNATVYNNGSYTCHAGNDRGNVSKTAIITVKGAGQECPIEITPARMVVQYQAREQNVTCKPKSTNKRHLKEIYWEVRQGAITKNSIWSVDTNEDWDLKPVCTATFNITGICKKHLNFTLYKTPDSVFVSTVHNLSSVVENKEFQLQCDITNVAPAGNLVVQWYQGNRKLSKGSLQVTGCLPENNTNCDISAVRSPLNVSSTISFTLDRNDKRAEFRCEAILDLGAEGLKPPQMMSSPLNITVHYKPSINTTKLPQKIPVFRGYPEELVCEADGHPPPKIQWFYSTVKVPHISEHTLIASEAGIYRCNATNKVDSTSHVVEVILKEDYLPLIAGFVAVTVVAISIVFLFIYSIYYKNTKMRRYSLKNAKLDTHSGNVAHNGWDTQFDMTKLS
ncbi:hypothetical protein PBY51_007735 [Eleginops maclovinus]|uniref:Ig-like domain-containing protein n=2 Tax=Eleginops maclovinus TaxID=56733 RepID=A0AAN7X857_ELEMC|nr:hypothetical protein PBY51_007735 [Eleginops maclovinus]